jgi:uncharacterized damage-inducible protein DinB
MRNPLAVQAELVGWLERRTAGLDPTVLRRAEAPGKWSVLEVVQHLADTEMVYGYRIRMTLTHEGWAMEIYGREAWARELHYREAELDDALSQLRGLRTANLLLYRKLTRAQLERTARHPDRGQQSIGELIDYLASHDLTHRAQIDRILDARPG